MTPNAWLKEQIPLAGFQIRIALAMQLLVGAITVAQAWLLALILDAVTFQDAGLDTIRPWLWWLLGLFSLRAAGTWLAESSAARGAARVKIALRDRLYRHLQTLGTDYLYGERSGALVESLTRGVDDLGGYYARFLPAAALSMALPLGIVLLVLPLDWLSALVMLVTAPLIPFFMILIGKGAERLNRGQWRELTRMGAHFLDAIQGLGTLKLFGAARREAAALARDSEAYRERTMRVLRVAFLSSAVLEFFATLSIAIIAVLIGFRLYRLELPLPDWLGVPEIGFLHGFFILLLAPELYLPLRNLGTQYHAKMEATAAAERLMEVLSDRSGIGIRETDRAASSPPAAEVPWTHPPLIRFDSVSFSYGPGREALQEIDLEIRPGERLALVGPSGAGKTTLMRLLLGLSVPSRGTIRVDGLDLAQLDLGHWRRGLAWVPQSPRLFRGTIAENICLGLAATDPRRAPDALCRAIRRARADGFIDTLPDGLDTGLGELGVGLSGGEVQRLALARAFLRDAHLVLLDEPSANLDPESARLVQAGIDNLAEGRTLITIAHRLETVQKADRILVMEQGRRVQCGDHDTLLSVPGTYRRLVSPSFSAREQAR